MSSFTIKDLENLSGIKAHTLRIWEQRYSFLKPSRSFTNIRYYSNDELKSILNIALLNKYGYKVSHIDKMSESEINDKILALNQSEAQQERIINELIQAMIDMKMLEFEEVLNAFIQQRGIERTLTQIIFPFLEKIGILWLTNHINPAQEHIVTNIIRQKIIVGIDRASSQLHPDKTLLLFLPEGEYHELGLLLVFYLLKSRGAKVIYLGSNMPLKDVEYVIKATKPTHLYTHLTTVAKNFNFEKFLGKLELIARNTPIIISGQQVGNLDKNVASNCHFKHSFAEVLSFVNNLSIS